MLVKTFCAAVNGLEVTTVTVEISMARGMQFHQGKGLRRTTASIRRNPLRYSRVYQTKTARDQVKTEYEDTEEVLCVLVSSGDGVTKRYPIPF